MNLSATVMADRLLSKSQLYSDVVSGVLNFNSLVKLSIKIILFKVGVDTTTSYNFFVFISNQIVGKEKGKSKTKL